MLLIRKPFNCLFRAFNSCRAFDPRSPFVFRGCCACGAVNSPIRRICHIEKVSILTLCSHLVPEATPPHHTMLVQQQRAHAHASFRQGSLHSRGLRGVVTRCAASSSGQQQQRHHDASIDNIDALLGAADGEIQRIAVHLGAWFLLKHKSKSGCDFAVC